MAERIPQSVSYLVVFRAFLSSDGKTPATGKTIAITISKNGGAFGNPNVGALNATEISSGFYKFTLDTTDTGTLGPVAWRGAEGTINDAGDVLSVANAHNAGFDGIANATFTAPPTTGAIATAVWQDVTAGDFTVASSIGKSLYTSGAAPGAASGLALVGSQVDLVNAPNATALAAVSSTIDAAALEGSITHVQAQRLILAGVVAGKTSGATSVGGTFHIRDAADSKDRVVATVDANGNRTAITTLDGT